MDFLERLFHISPDGGTGMTEAAIVFALFAVVSLAGYFAWRRRDRKSS